MCCFHSGRRTSSRLPPRRAHSFGQNTRSCPRSYRTGDSKPLPRVFLEVILAGKNFCALSRTNKGCSRSTKTFACRTIPIARSVRSRSRWPSGRDRLKGEQVEGWRVEALSHNPHCHSERSEESLNFVFWQREGRSQRCFTSLNMTYQETLQLFNPSTPPNI